MIASFFFFFFFAFLARYPARSVSGERGPLPRRTEVDVLLRERSSVTHHSPVVLTPECHGEKCRETGKD